MLINHGVTGAGIAPDRHRRDMLGHRQTLGHNLLHNLVAFWPLSAVAKQFDVHAGRTLVNTGAGHANGLDSTATAFSSAQGFYCYRASEPALQVGDEDFTFCTWVYGTSFSAAHGYITKDNTALAGGREYSLQYNAVVGRFRFTVSATGTGVTAVDANALGAPSINTWYLLFGWHDAAANTINIAVNNGAANSASHSTGVFSGNTEFRIGKFADNVGAVDGRMQRVGFWRRVLTADERAWLYRGGRGRDYPFV